MPISCWGYEMRTTTEIFREAVANVPEDVRLETDWSFAISDKIADALEKKGITAKSIKSIKQYLVL